MSLEGLPELAQLQILLAESEPFIRSRELARVKIPRGDTVPILGLAIGSTDPRAPTFGLFGGVHGLERVGTHTVLAYLESLLENLRWDAHLRKRFETCRLVAIPLVNPAGMFLNRRSNARGVDLMRNAPVEAERRPAPLLGGHRLGPHIPWFRGHEGEPMEVESEALAQFVREEMFQAEAALALDVHSGFGIRDRLWYPYAKSQRPFPREVEVHRLRQLFDRSYPHHVYHFEPQSASYTTHGDLWDYLFDEFYESQDRKRVFVPWTLEMGSWSWVRKNPQQLFYITGAFNPFRPHRLARVLRRHLMLMNFFLRAVDCYRVWTRRTQDVLAPLPMTPTLVADTGGHRG